MNNDRLIQLRSGRLLAPCQRLDKYPLDTHSITQLLYSDDNGKTWRETDSVDIIKNPDGADEPGVVELKDERVLMYFRTALGSIYQSFSTDQGVSWTEPKPTSLEAPVSPSVIKRIPSTGDLVLIWNHSLPQHNPWHSDRFPLTSAISRDDGKTWQNVRDFEVDPLYTYSYPSLTFEKDHALLTYGQNIRDQWIGLKFRSVPIHWFYERDPS